MNRAVHDQRAKRAGAQQVGPATHQVSRIHRGPRYHHQALVEHGQAAVGIRPAEGQRARSVLGQRAAAVKDI